MSQIESLDGKSRKSVEIDDGQLRQMIDGNDGKSEPGVKSILLQPTVDLIKPVDQSENTTEFLMLTLQSALNYTPQQV